MYVSYPRAGTTELPDIAPFDDPYRGLKALLDAAIYQRRFDTNWDAVDRDNFTDGNWVCLFLFSYFHLMFAITCMILLVRLLMAMMTNTFQTVKKQAQLEWRLLIARNVLRLELVFSALISTPMIAYCLPPQMPQRKFAGNIPSGGSEHVHTFLHVEHAPDAPSAVPLLLARQGGNDLYDADEQKAAAALRTKREERVKAARAARRVGGVAGGAIVGAIGSGKHAEGAAAAGGVGVIAAAADLAFSSGAARDELRMHLSAALKLLSDYPSEGASSAGGGAAGSTSARIPVAPVQGGAPPPLATAAATDVAVSLAPPPKNKTALRALSSMTPSPTSKPKSPAPSA